MSEASHLDAEDEKCEQESDRDPSCVHVVAIGASAGGLESLEQFFKEMPADSGLAFIVLQHLSPDFRSLMDELLARHTKMTIRKAEDDMAVEANTIYLNPPRKNMIVSGGNLYLSELEPSESLSLPIDQFFRSLAQDYRRHAIAIVLSGTGSDGSRGIRDVYEAGGLVLSEAEETAKFDGMPRSAQETGCVHLVLPPDAMPEALVSYVNQSLNPQDFAEEMFVPPRLSGMETVFRLIRDAYGIDFAHYKPNTVIRRVERRVAMLQAGDVRTYVAQLEEDAEELNALYRDLLIGVTRFFRDRDAFDFLTTEVLPTLIEDKEDGDEFRVWSAGCATGEEAYSMAMLIDDAVTRSGKNLDIKIFATDVHPTSLEFAAAGIYPTDSLAQANPQFVKKYFEEVRGGYRIINRIRQMIVFARHNVFKDAPFTKLDLVSCRNLLIYLQPLAQSKAISLFHFGLRTAGVMMLGPSESPGELKNEFDTMNNRWKIYRKRRDVRLSAEIRMPLSSLADSGNSGLATPRTRQAASPQRDLLLAYDQLLDKYIPAAFLIDEDRQLIHVFGDGKNYLETRPGRVSSDLLERVRVDLKPSMGSAIQRVRRGAETKVSTSVRLENEGHAEVVKIDVERLSDGPSRQCWFIVSVISEVPAPIASRSPEPVSETKFSQDRMNDLELELKYAKESLQTTVEELETSNEELQATNEELVASNEELQSTNEELHSVNEELYTVNAEYQNKIAELTEMTTDMESLLESTEIGTIFLDADLAIRKFTGQVASWFDLVHRDIGRKIAAFSHNLNCPSLLDDLHTVMIDEQPIEREIQDQNRQWLHLRLHPYRQDDVVKGVVMTLIDISNLKQTRAKLQQLSAIVESSDDAIIGKDFDGKIESWNAAAEHLFGYTAEEAIGRNISLILPPETAGTVQDYRNEIQAGRSVEPLEGQRIAKDGRYIDVVLRFSPIRDVAGDIVGISAVCRDISQRRQTERELDRLALAVQHTDNAVLLTDPAGKIEWVNEGFTQITGYSPQDAMGRKPGDFLQGPDSDHEVVRHMREQIAKQEGFNVEIINYSKEGRRYWLAIDARPVVNDDGVLTGFMAVERDITTLKQAQADAEREVQRRDEFLAMLSHELRNPLGALRSGLQLLQHTNEDPSSESRKEIEEVLASQVNQMSRLLDDLLDVSRITQGKILIQKEPFDLRVAARDAVSAVQPMANRRGCPIQLDLAADPVVVCGDAARLQQVQANLLTNAVRHSHRGDSITLALKQVDGQAVITVTDQGEGIEPELQAKVFELFFQSNSEIARTEGGLGVGLSLVRDLVNEHGGDVIVESLGSGHGAKFVVTIPLANRDSSLADEESMNHVSSMRIVVVEDQDANRQLLRKLLEIDGHQVWEAETAGAGIELIREIRPDIALVDIGLPDMPGYELATAIKKLSPCPVTLLAALSGYGQEADVKKALSAGFDLHLVKPLDTGLLNEIIMERFSG